MSRRVVCPSCGIKGTESIDDHAEFEVRGVHNGKAIRRCRNCGAGIAVGVFSGLLFGKPTLIPNDLWQRMEAVWAREFGGNKDDAVTAFRTWAQLAKGEREQLQLMIMSLQEFSYAFQRAVQLTGTIDESSATARFYAHSMYQYCANYYTISGPLKLRVQLDQLGSADLLEPIVEMLDTTLGSTTFGEIVDVFRDKFLVHQSFRLDVIEKHVYKKFDMSDEGNALYFASLVQKLFKRTQELYVNLTMRFPEAT
jgi:hypothetical protein